MKKNLFEDEKDLSNQKRFEINKKFAKKYHHNEKRKEKERLLEKYKDQIISSSDSEIEDEKGV